MKKFTKFNLNIILGVLLLVAIVFSVIKIVQSAALDPGHAWDTLDDAPLPIANGGTGQILANSSFNALAPSQTGNSGKFLTTNGTDTSWAAPSGGAPSGNEGEVQYKSGSSFAGAANIEIESGNLRLVGITVPSAPSAGNLLLYARSRAGKMFAEMIGPAGIDTSLQPALFGNNVVMWVPGTGTTAALAFGTSWTVAATQAHPALATTNLLTSMKRATYTTSTTSGNASGIRMSATQFWRGNAAGLGGFFFFARFGVVTFESTMQIWVGLSGITTLLAGEPSAQNNTVAMGKDTGDANWQLIFRSGSAVTKVDLGLAVAANQVFDVMFFAPPNGSAITARVVRLDSAAVLADNTVHTTNLPTNTTFMIAHAEARTNTTSAVAIALNRIYIESDY